MGTTLSLLSNARLLDWRPSGLNNCWSSPPLGLLHVWLSIHSLCRFGRCSDKFCPAGRFRVKLIETDLDADFQFFFAVSTQMLDWLKVLLETKDLSYCIHWSVFVARVLKAFTGRFQLRNDPSWPVTLSLKLNASTVNCGRLVNNQCSIKVFQ